MLKSRDKAYYRNLLRSTLTISVEDVDELGVWPAGEVLASKRIAHDSIITEDDDQLITQANAEYRAVLFGYVAVLPMQVALDEGQIANDRQPPRTGR